MSLEICMIFASETKTGIGIMSTIDKNEKSAINKILFITFSTNQTK